MACYSAIIKVVIKSLLGVRVGRAGAGRCETRVNCVLAILRPAPHGRGQGRPGRGLRVVRVRVSEGSLAYLLAQSGLSKIVHDRS